MDGLGNTGSQEVNEDDGVYVDNVPLARATVEVLYEMGYTDDEIEEAFKICLATAGGDKVPTIENLVDQIAACRAERRQKLQKSDSFQSSKQSSVMVTPNSAQLKGALERAESQDLPSPTEPAFTPRQETFFWVAKREETKELMHSNMDVQNNMNKNMYQLTLRFLGKFLVSQQEPLGSPSEVPLAPQEAVKAGNPGKHVE